MLCFCVPMPLLPIVRSWLSCFSRSLCSPEIWPRTRGPDLFQISLLCQEWLKTEKKTWSEEPTQFVTRMGSCLPGVWSSLVVSSYLSLYMLKHDSSPSLFLWAANHTQTEGWRRTEKALQIKDVPVLPAPGLFLTEMLVNCVSLFIRPSVASFSAPSHHLSIHSSTSCTTVAVRGDERVQSRVLITGKQWVRVRVCQFVHCFESGTVSLTLGSRNISKIQTQNIKILILATDANGTQPSLSVPDPWWCIEKTAFSAALKLLSDKNHTDWLFIGANQWTTAWDTCADSRLCDVLQSKNGGSSGQIPVCFFLLSITFKT